MRPRPRGRPRGARPPLCWRAWVCERVTAAISAECKLPSVWTGFDMGRPRIVNARQESVLQERDVMGISSAFCTTTTD